MTEQIDSHCGEYFVVAGEYIYFQGTPSKRALCKKRVDSQVTSDAELLDPNCGRIAIKNNKIYFQGGANCSGLYSMDLDGRNVIQMDPHCAEFLVGDKAVYFRGGPSFDGLYKVDFNSTVATPIHAGFFCGKLGSEFLTHLAYDAFLFRGGPSGSSLYLQHGDSESTPHEFAIKSGDLFLQSPLFNSWGQEIFYLSNTSTKSSLIRGSLEVKHDRVTGKEIFAAHYMCSGVKKFNLSKNGDIIITLLNSNEPGIYKLNPVKKDTVSVIDPYCEDFIIVDDMVYFQGGPEKTGLYRAPIDCSRIAEQLDENCGNLLAPGDGYIYFQGGGDRTGLYRLKI